MKKDSEKEFKKEIIDKIVHDLQVRATEIHEDPNTNVKDRLSQMDVIWNLFKLLEHYEENMKVLGKYWSEKKWKAKFDKYRDEK